MTTYLINHLRIPNEVPNDGGLEYLEKSRQRSSRTAESGLCSASTTRCSKAPGPAQ